MSGNSGVTFIDASECSDADGPFTADDTVYQLIVTNYGKDKAGFINTVAPNTVAPDGEFTITFGGSDLKADSYVEIVDANGVTELNRIPTSCSQPLTVGDVFGTLEVVGNNGLRPGIEVTYFYEVNILKDVLFPPPPATITSGERLKLPKDRTVKAGDTGKILELEFDVNFPYKKNQDPDDFDLTVTFEQGCEVSF